MKKSIILLIVFAFLSFLVVSSCSEMKDPVSGLDEKIDSGIEKQERIPIILAVAGIAARGYATSCVLNCADEYFNTSGLFVTLGSIPDLYKWAAKQTIETATGVASGTVGGTSCQDLLEFVEEECCNGPTADETCTEVANNQGYAIWTSCGYLRVKNKDGDWEKEYFAQGTEIRFTGYDCDDDAFTNCSVYYQKDWRECYNMQRYNRQVYRSSLAVFVITKIEK